MRQTSATPNPKHFIQKKVWFATQLLAFLMWQTTAHGLVESGPSSIDHLAERANLVFKGQVVKVESRFAQPLPNQTRPAPYTFVTYQVEQILKGELTESAMTLRFAGGPYNNDEFTLVDGLPLMDVGDRDVLFVRDNGKDPCPLVDCSSGRFREIEGFIFNELGQSIELTEDNQIRFGKAVSLEDVQSHKMSKDIQLTRYESELVDEYMSVENFRDTQPVHGMRPDPAGFLVLVGDAVQRAKASSENANETFRENNLNPDEPFADNFFAAHEAPPAPEPQVPMPFVAQVDEPWPVQAESAISIQPIDATKSEALPTKLPEVANEAVASNKAAETERNNRYGFGGLLLIPALALLWRRRRQRR